MAFSYRLSTCALLLGTLTATTSVCAEEAFRQHDAHVHGIVEFNIAQDGQDLLMEITAPGADIVGFEHAPTNTEQHQALEAALLQLKQADTLFALTPSAQCHLTEALVTETLTAHDSHAGHDHDEHNHDSHAGHDHDEHGHDSHAGHDHDEHDHDSHAGHDHDEHDHDSHAGHDHEDQAHGEFSAQYTFRCDDIKQLTNLQVSWFKHFPSTEQIAIQAITETSQKAAQLTPSSTLFKF